MLGPFKAAIAANWALMASSTAEIDVQVSVRRHADIAATEQSLVNAETISVASEELVLCHKTTLPEEIDAAASSERASREATLVTTRALETLQNCLLYTSPSPRDGLLSRMPSSA